MSAAIASRPARKGSPLAMLAILMAVWITGRAFLWENPFPIDPFDLPGAQMLLAQDGSGHQIAPGDGVTQAVGDPITQQGGSWVGNGFAGNGPLGDGYTGFADPYSASHGLAQVAAGHQVLLHAAFAADWSGHRPAAAELDQPAVRRAGTSPIAPPFARSQNIDRWSLDAWAFGREGSRSAPISQGRVPIYGASQIGANLQYRIDPANPRDPRAYVRAYRALVENGESEVAAGVSARPIAALPVRVAGELRVTDNPFGTEVRPAAYAITEIPPIALPAGVTMEAYGGAGYVGGNVATGFVDGQLAATRRMAELEGPFAGSSPNPLRISLGAGAWGGAQEGASRLDVGPTMRIDLNVGDVPARVSLDWRERVAGDAAPNSGLAATLSTRF